MTSAFGGQHSIQLSYGCLGLSLAEACGGFNAKGRKFLPATGENARSFPAAPALAELDRIPGTGWIGRSFRPRKVLS